MGSKVQSTCWKAFDAKTGGRGLASRTDPCLTPRLQLESKRHNSVLLIALPGPLCYAIIADGLDQPRLPQSGPTDVEA